MSKKTNKEFKEEVKNLVGNEYTVLGEYINNKTKIKIKHNICGHEYMVRPNDFQQGYRCPECDSLESLSLTNVKKYLTKNNIIFETEKSFDNLKLERSLRFDLFLIKYNLLIEFDGQQHFIVRGNTVFKNDMNIRVKRDWIKNNWISKNNYKLLRIPFSICDNKIIELIESIISNNINYDFINENNIFYFDGNNFYNKLKYYSHRNKNYFSLYENEIEEGLTHNNEN